MKSLPAKSSAANVDLDIGNMRTMAEFSRAMLASVLGSQFGGDRQLYTVLGYKTAPGFSDFLAQYERHDIAKRIIDAPVNATWRRPPAIREDQDSGNRTPFELDLEALSKRLSLWNKLARLDKLAGLGQYGVLVIGTRGAKLNEPMQKKSLKGPADVLYVMPYSEPNATIQEFDTRETSPRFGRPKMYRVNVSAGVSPRQMQVHWSRIIHVADDALQNEIHGTPRLLACINRLFDHEKVLGGSAEMFWQGAYRGPVMTTQKDFAANFQAPSPTEQAADKAKMDEYIHGLMRTLGVTGLDVNWPDTVNPDPEKVLDGIMDALSAATGIPKRILLGSERGELASSQDERNWNARITERQTNFAEPSILRALLDRLIEAGALTAPTSYYVEWPTLFEMSDTEKADLALKKAQTIAAFAPAGQANSVVPDAEFRESILGLPAQPEDRFMPGAEVPLDEEPPPEDDLSGEDSLDNAGQ